MPLKQKLYSISETEKLLCLPAKDLGVLVKDGELTSEPMIHRRIDFTLRQAKAH